MYHFRPARATASAVLPAVLATMVVATLGAGCARPSATERARTLSREDRDDEAVAVLREDLAEHPEDAAARKLLVRIYAYQGDLPRARAEVAELRRRSRADDPTPLVELGHAYELVHDFDAALAAYDEAANVAPSSPVGPREGGMRCARWGEVEAARPRLEEAVRRGAHDAATWHALGLVRVHVGDLAAAEQAYRAGVAADPADASNLLGLATVAVLRDDGAAALAAYDGVLRVSPRYAPAELGRAWALARLGRAKAASDALDRASELGAAPASVARARARLHAAPPSPAAPPVSGSPEASPSEASAPAEGPEEPPAAVVPVPPPSAASADAGDGAP